MIELYLAIIKSLAVAVGGKIGAVAVQIADSIQTLTDAKVDLEATIKPWVLWINGIIAEKRDLTPEEDAAVNAFGDAIHANNQSLAANGPPVAIPSPP